MPDHNDQNFIDPAAAESTERKGMKILLTAGVICFTAGLYLSREIGALDPETLLGHPPFSGAGSTIRNDLFVLLMYNSPWLIGLTMTATALKYFFRTRK